MRPLPLLAALVLAACGSAPPPSAPPDGPRLPMPTEHWLDDRAEGRQASLRKAWIRERHLAPPGVDWRAVERANGERLRRKRNLLTTLGAAQPVWTERGSRNQAGRVHVAVHSPDGQTLYVGSAKGGLWRGDLDGTGWTPIGDDLYGGAHWLAVLPHPSGGAAPAILRATDGGAVHLSLDDGTTWIAPVGLPQSSAVRRVLRTPGAEPAAFVLCRQSSAWNASWGLYRSTDGGQSFALVRDLGSSAGDLWTSRTAPGALYLVDGDRCFSSLDLGTTWTLRGELPAGGSGDAELAGSEAGAPRLWAIQDTGSGQRLARSDDAGASWTVLQSVDDYWGTLRASTVDVDLFAWGGVECHRTTDGGQSFQVVNPWGAYYSDPANKLHADLPGMDVVPDGQGGERWYLCTDGGLYRSTDGLATVQNLSLEGLGISQYYTTLTSSADPDHVVAGSQDQGWQRADVPPAGGSDQLDFAQLISGDYGHATSSDGSHDFVFSVYPGFVLVQRGEDSPQLFTEDFPAGESHAWMPPVRADPIRKDSFFLCASKLWRYNQVGGSSQWTPTLHSAQDFALQGGEYLTGLTFSPVDDARVYAVTSAGRLWRSDDRGVTWTQGGGSAPGPQYFYGTAILASSTAVDTAWVGGSGYGYPGVWRTTDGGATWQPFDDGLPDTLVYCLGEAPDGSGALFAGTEMEVFRRDPGGAWYDISGGVAPAVPFWSVEPHPDGQTMRFGTYGRGIWDYRIQPPCGWVAYGVGLGGANDLLLDCSAAPRLGVDQTFLVSGAPQLTSGIVGLATASASLPLAGGTILVEPAGLLPLAFNTLLGTSGVTVAVPDDPALIGVACFAQALVLGPTPGELHLSNGLTATICP